MRVILFISIVLIATVSFGQATDAQKAAIDAEVQRISKNSKLRANNFSIRAQKKVLHYISYQYLADQSGYVKISRQFSHKNDSIRQTFYLKNGQLILATESIVSYYAEKNQADSIAWGGDFYFSGGKLIDYTTLGHGKSEMESWNPEQDMLTAFNESKRDIARYKKKKAAANNLSLRSGRYTAVLP